ncbi:hypothetical protein GCM10008916_08840 [Clostridium nitritogenes]|uniref:GIY-YIG domain-containing protein n=1 Tax=Clostridium nitritogenes TaxID=83340 RepID=A0ABN1LKF9_9CLOT
MNKKLCGRCGINPRRKNHPWCLECFQKYKKEWDNSHKGYFLYIVMDKNKKILYVGATENIQTRMDNHLSGNSHIKCLIQSDEWEVIKFTDITDLVGDREELSVLENNLIEVYKPKYNKKVNRIRNVEELRIFSLISKLHSLDTHWRTFITREKYLKKY